MKRVNYSARTVIGAEPTLKLGQVGIPYEVAQIHTKPEVVTHYNIDWLTDLIKNNKANFRTTTKEGKEIKGNSNVVRFNLHYPFSKNRTELLVGDTVISGRDGKKRLISNISVLKEMKIQKGDKILRNGKIIVPLIPEQKPINLKIGDIVERQLLLNDISVFNRQPSLHRGSILGTTVVPMLGKTFRFNLAGTKIFNADFDFLCADF